MTIHYFVHHRPGRSPGQRFRCELFLTELEGAGYHIRWHALLPDEGSDKLFYSPGRYVAKARLLWQAWRRRKRSLREVQAGDIVFVYREAFPLGSIAIERAAKKRGARLVLDFDDAIWLRDVSAGNKALAFLKRPAKTATLCRLADLVIVGNDYLAEYARQFNPNVVVVPTVVDTEVHSPKYPPPTPPEEGSFDGLESGIGNSASSSQPNTSSHPQEPVSQVEGTPSPRLPTEALAQVGERGPGGEVQKPGGEVVRAEVVLGWTGSETTVRHFNLLLPILEQVQAKYGNRVRFKLITNRPVSYPTLGLEATLWNREEEVAQLAGIDIGLMPLPDDAWARGKCGFKLIQYMALRIPAVASPVGVNTELVRHGENGFLAATEDEWLQYLSILIEDAALRTSLGRSGRDTIVSRYSRQSWAERYISIFDSAR